MPSDNSSGTISSAIPYSLHIQFLIIFQLLYKVIFSPSLGTWMHARMQTHTHTHTKYSTSFTILRLCVHLCFPPQSVNSLRARIMPKAPLLFPVTSIEAKYLGTKGKEDRRTLLPNPGKLLISTPSPSSGIGN